MTPHYISISTWCLSCGWKIPQILVKPSTFVTQRPLEPIERQGIIHFPSLDHGGTLAKLRPLKLKGMRSRSVALETVRQNVDQKTYNGSGTERAITPEVSERRTLVVLGTCGKLFP